MGYSKDDMSSKLHKLYAPVRVYGQLTQVTLEQLEVDMMPPRNNTTRSMSQLL